MAEGRSAPVLVSLSGNRAICTVHLLICVSVPVDGIGGSLFKGLRRPAGEFIGPDVDSAAA